MGELLEDGRRKVNAGICAARCSQHETGLLLSDSKSERSLTEVKYREPFWLHVGEKLQAFATRQSADSMRLLTGSCSPSRLRETVLHLLGEGFEFRYNAVEFVDECVRAGSAEYIDERAVVPERAVLAPGEAAEDGIAFHAIIGEDLAGVGQFVGGGNEADVI